MVDQRPFFFETLAWVDNNIFLFQQHLKVACNLLSPLTCACLLPLNNSLGNKRFNFKISFRNICIIIPFPTCFPTRYMRLIVFKSYHVSASGWAFGL
jgi:hypothetical protein